MFVSETVLDLVDKPGSSFVWAPKTEFSDPNLRIFIEQNVVQNGVPVVVTNVSKGMLFQTTRGVSWGIFLSICFILGIRYSFLSISFHFSWYCDYCYNDIVLILFIKTGTPLCSVGNTSAITLVTFLSKFAIQQNHGTYHALWITSHHSPLLPTRRTTSKTHTTSWRIC